MKKINLCILAFVLVAFTRGAFAADQGLHLGGLDRETKKAKIEAKKIAHETARERKKLEKGKKKAARSGHCLFLTLNGSQHTK